MKKTIFLFLLVLFLLSGCKSLFDSLDADAPRNHVYRDPDQQSQVVPEE